MGSSTNKVRVWCRIKPTSNFVPNVINISPDKKSINIHAGQSVKQDVVNNQIHDWLFKLDGVLHNVSQEEVYNEVAADLVNAALMGYNGTILCYGQTGAGKTFTISGVHENFQYRGLIPRAISQLFKQIEDCTENVISVRISYLEIYNETLFDLLSTLPEYVEHFVPDQLSIVESDKNVYIKGLSYHLVRNEEEALNLLFEGETNRIIGQHSLNSHSSRSHCIFTIFVESHSSVDSDAKYTISKLNFVDLAGSERLKKTQSAAKTQAEALYINKSLSFLEQVVVAMADKKRDHIPFRQSKLTHFLKDSIGGHSNTVLIANVWGELQQIEETISTLRFATRMMCVPMVPTVNKYDDHKILVKKMKQEISQLKVELAMHDTLANRTQINYEPLTYQQKLDLKRQLERFLQGSLDELEIINVCQIQTLFDLFREMYNSKIVASAPSRFERKSPTTVSPNGIVEKKSDEIVVTPSDNILEKLSERPGTPPQRSVAFEEFKHDQGSEVNKELSTNKETLNTLKKNYVTLAREINMIKCEIDNTKYRLEESKAERVKQGTLYSEEGEEAISEEEFQLVKTLKNLKRDYRSKFDQLMDLKTEVSYYQNLVHHCRQKLVQEFENWFVECFLPNGEDVTSGNQRFKLNSSLEDELEKFDRLQNELLLTEETALPFHKAYMNTQLRKNLIRNTNQTNQSEIKKIMPLTNKA
ncbi:kinesin-like protein KIF9 isoform X2 [Octopus bimaculoides]|uniref:Kinesin-like protein n=1 Tax=Octopus bimaculoides TaxID=37653 RepID=A0A0L8FL64_OCTBM|nr:kinesin-like protein KIF9 isoform X2 [Octopus bimaculoides]|eukprot:XP_014788863.1 PREDICTED: kinesin-like protein KIF9 isoform X2 [Octopus bimaculoides]